MRLYDRPVSNHYLQEVDRLFPILKENKIYRRLFFHLSFPKALSRDIESGYILVSESILATIEYKEVLLDHNNYKGITLLESFKRDVLPDFQWSNYSHRDNKARAVINTGFSPEYQRLLDAEKDRVWNSYGRTFFLDRKVFNRANQEKYRVLQRKEAFEMMKATENPDAQFVGNYLNNLDSRGFTEIIRKNMEDAITAANNVVFKPKRTMLEAERLAIQSRIRERNIDILATIEAQSLPLYRPVTGTTRLFTITEHIGNLNTEVREVLTRGWVEVDLRSSQLAITATLWGVTEVVDFLRCGGNIWYELLKTYDVDYSLVSDVKDAFKQALYAILFGADAGDVQRHLTNALKAIGINKRGDLFMNHWIIKSMVDARNTQIQQITMAGGAYNVYNDWLSTPVDDPNDKKLRFNVESILAQQAQAVELKIITTLFRLAAGNSDFTIQLYQYDGISIRFHNDMKRESYLQRMKDEVQSISESLGIPITLSVK